MPETLQSQGVVLPGSMGGFRKPTGQTPDSSEPASVYPVRSMLSPPQPGEIKIPAVGRGWFPVSLVTKDYTQNPYSVVGLTARKWA
jgi:hypothetical protein